MALEINGVPQGGSSSNIASYSVTENATPTDPNSSSGGFGQVTFTMPEWPLARLMIDNGVSLSDGIRGRMMATVRDVSGTSGRMVTFTADNELGKMNVDRIAEPVVGKMSQAIQYYLDLVGISAALEFQVPDYDVALPGFVGNVWEHVKWLMAAHSLELSLVFESVVVRPLRTIEAYMERHQEWSYNVNTQDAARAVEVNYYNHIAVEDAEVYPLVTEEASIQQVDAREEIVVEIPINASLSAVNQPEHVYTTGPENKSGTKGVYTVVGNDDLPITPAQWAGEGGYLKVEIAEPSLLRVRIRGANNESLAPFRIAMSAGGTDYNSLHITGTGVAWDTYTALLYTGADPNNVSEEIGTTVENPFISTLAQAYTVGQITAAAYSGLTQTVSGTAQNINRPGENRELVRATLVELDNYHSQSMTIADFNVSYADETLEEFGARWDKMFLEDFPNQVFGNAGGARIKIGDAQYRITEATINSGTLNYSAEMDTIVRDFNEVWAGRTASEFNEAFFNMSLKDISLMPLWDGTD